MADERAPQVSLRIVCLSIASLTVLIASAALAQVTTASLSHAATALSEKKDARSNPLDSPLFLPAVTYDAGGDSSQSIAVGDLNGDGKPDLVVANQCARGGDNDTCPTDLQNVCLSSDYCLHGAVGVLLGNGDGTFRPTVTYESGEYQSMSVALGDFNGDRRLDLALANACGNFSDCLYGTVDVMFGNGDGTFGPVWTYSSHGYYPVSVAVADINGDGSPDLLVANTCYTKSTCSESDCTCTAGSIDVFLNDGYGGFGTSWSYDSGAPWAHSVSVGDLNGDGKPDLVVANDRSAGVLLGNGDGTFQSAFAYGTGSGVLSVAVGDVNGDGKLDLLAANVCPNWTLPSDPMCPNGTVGVLLGNGDGILRSAVLYGSGGRMANSVAVTDVNGDGKPDLVVTNYFGLNGDTRALGVLLGNGDGSFQTAVVFGSGGRTPYSVAVGDVNRDGKPDVVVANDLGALGVLLNNAAFDRTPPVITVSANPKLLWPPTGKMARITLSGTITDTGSGVNLTSAAYAVKDEYGKVQPTGAITLGPGGSFSFTLLLQSSRLGTDLDGRRYTVTVQAKDNAGNRGFKTSLVTVPHDQGTRMIR